MKDLNDKKRFYIRCENMDETMVFESWLDDGFTTISYGMDAFYRNQLGFFHRIWHSTKLIFSIVFGKEFYFYNIAISDNKTLDEFKTFVSEMREIDEQSN